MPTPRAEGVLPSGRSDRPTGWARAFALSVVLTLIAGGGLLASRGAADAAGSLAQLHIDTLYQTGRSPDAVELGVVESLVALARRLDPGSPDWMAQQGRVFEWRASLAARGGDPAGERRLREQALAVYRAAIERRPPQVWSWLDLAYAKYRAAQFDDEFQSAIARAGQTGPWQRQAQLSRVRLAILTWSQLSPRNRLDLGRTIRHLAAHAPKSLFPLTATPGGRALVCSFGRNDSTRLAAHCDS